MPSGDCNACHTQAGTTTLTGMDAAQRLYRKFGFEPLCGPLGKTGHFGCDRYFARAL